MDEGRHDSLSSGRAACSRAEALTANLKHKATESQPIVWA